MEIKKRPNPNEAFPNPNIPSLCFIKNVVKSPRIIIGDYTYYDDVDGADQFEKHVTHFYDFIGDYAENIVEYADALKEQNAIFSDDAVAEIKKMEQLIVDLYNEIMLAYHKLDLEVLERANMIEDSIDDYTDQMEQNHIERLVHGVCTPSVGAEYLSLAQNSERVADHLTNVGKTILDLV